MFKDPLITEKDRIGNKHSWEHIIAHNSGYPPRALSLLGFNYTGASNNPPYIDLRNGNVYDRVKNLRWEDPWLEGEHFSSALKWYWNQLTDKDKSLDDPFIKDYFMGL
ncbi:MAG: hypothetical protein HC830_05970 [Bacteroidetes bacterium]|nr:hypothetical protein [Bacteroidota bacterium]